LTKKEKKRVSLKVQQLKMALREKSMEKKVEMNIKEDGILIRLEAPVLFPLGSANLKTDIYPVLDKIIELTEGWPNSIRIDGHTDNAPINTVRYPSNWELSTSRAIAVLRFFIQRGVPASRLAAVGYGEFHPLVPNTTPENCAINRRVEIFIKYKEQEIRGKDIKIITD
ncbi:MAG: OmpA family protein, partial [Calditrichia bacterium]|nr:OmpA family protein [Calditrichia bacterium]